MLVNYYLEILGVFASSIWDTKQFIVANNHQRRLIKLHHVHACWTHYTVKDAVKSAYMQVQKGYNDA